MKKIMLLALFVAISCASYAQKTDSVKTKSTVNGNNEIRLNLINTIAGLPEINYERILKSDMAVGIGVLVGADADSDIKFGAIPNFRLYFGAKKAAGFFVEANAGVFAMERITYYSYNSTGGYYSNSGSSTSVNFGLGAAAGGKFLTKSGFVGEAYLGLGRIFGDASTDVYPRTGITIGKRF